MNTFSKKAKWIGLGESFFHTGIVSPAMQLRKTFEYNGNGDVECLICGLGCYVLYINGVRVGEDLFAPAFTAYDKRSLYLRYDVSSYLTKGQNVIAVKLGDGHFNQTTRDTWNLYNASWRNYPRLLLELFENGETVLSSNETWKATYDGPTVHNAIRTGEFYDARKEDGWRAVGYDDSSWENVKIVRSPGGIIEEQTMPSIKEMDALKPVSITKCEKGWLCDFGKNIAGYVGIKMSGKAGDTVTIRYSENLNGNEIDQKNISCYVLSGEFSCDKYTFSGNGVEEWKPDFAYHGFRYVEISGVDEMPDIDSITAYHVYTEIEKTGSFSCSNELVQWIYDATILSFLNNYHGYPEDCPHREKNGWTGDAWLSSHYAVTSFDIKESYKKWLVDICDTQRITGQICSIAPTSGWGYNWGSGPSFDFVLFFLPYITYIENGDVSLLEYAYPFMKKYLGFAETFEIQNGTVQYGLGDWQAPKGEEVSNRFSDSCFYYAMFDVAAKVAALLGDGECKDSYANKAESIKSTLKKLYISDDGVDTNGEGALSYALFFGLVEGELAEKLAKMLAEKVKANEYKFTTGIFGTKAVLAALSKYGYTDVAFKMVNRTDFPSFGYWKELGATTLWETWKGDMSKNHHMFGTVICWMKNDIAGLQNVGVAYDKCNIKPYFFDEKCDASASLITPRGKLSVAWTKDGDKFRLRAEIPSGTEATLILGEDKRVIECGTVDIEIEL